MVPEDAPIWLDWVEPEVANLIEEELQEYVDEWQATRDEYLSEREKVSKDDPKARQLGYSAWMSGRRRSSGGREQARRVSRVEHDPPSTPIEDEGEK